MKLFKKTIKKSKNPIIGFKIVPKSQIKEAEGEKKFYSDGLTEDQQFLLDRLNRGV